MDKLRTRKVYGSGGGSEDRMEVSGGALAEGRGGVVVLETWEDSTVFKFADSGAMIDGNACASSRSRTAADGSDC